MKSYTDTGSFLGSLWMVVAAVCFCTMGILVKAAGGRFAMHEYELVFWRVIFATIVLGVQACIAKQSFATAYPKAHFWRSAGGYAWACDVLFWLGASAFGDGDYF